MKLKYILIGSLTTLMIPASAISCASTKNKKETSKTKAATTTIPIKTLKPKISLPLTPLNAKRVLDDSLNWKDIPIKTATNHFLETGSLPLYVPYDGLAVGDPYLLNPSNSFTSLSSMEHDISKRVVLGSKKKHYWRDSDLIQYRKLMRLMYTKPTSGRTSEFLKKVYDDFKDYGAPLDKWYSGIANSKVADYNLMGISHLKEKWDSQSAADTKYIAPTSNFNTPYNFFVRNNHTFFELGFRGVDILNNKIDDSNLRAKPIRIEYDENFHIVSVKQIIKDTRPWLEMKTFRKAGFISTTKLGYGSTMYLPLSKYHDIMQSPLQDFVDISNAYIKTIATTTGISEEDIAIEQIGNSEFMMISSLNSNKVGGSFILASPIPDVLMPHRNSRAYVNIMTGLNIMLDQTWNETLQVNKDVFEALSISRKKRLLMLNNERFYFSFMGSDPLVIKNILTIKQVLIQGKTTNFDPTKFLFE